jgi:outer membrane protein assembly factor BamB
MFKDGNIRLLDRSIGLQPGKTESVTKGSVMNLMIKDPKTKTAGNRIKRTIRNWIYVVLIVALLLPIFISGQMPTPVVAQAEQTNTIYFPTVQKPQQQPTGGDGTCGQSGGEWPTVAANPQRTSWTDEEVCGDLQAVWYRPIEAYIPQNVQVIAAQGLLYIATSAGLYALDADNGALVWRFDTEMPLGNSPTVKDGVVYVGGHDRKLYALNAATGQLLWSFNQAKAGFDTNPLVVAGRVFVGNRDGKMYAIGAHGTAQQGQLLWSFQTGGPIHFSAAYSNGNIYFASNDNHAYALNETNGTQVWKSVKLPGDGYHSFWPVVYGDTVVFSASSPYRMGSDPGTRTILDPIEGTEFGDFRLMERETMMANAANGTLVGPVLAAQPWSNGYPVLDASVIAQYYENNPTPDLFKHKYWRRTFIVLNQSNGTEYNYDSDGDGRAEYMPYGYWGTNSGNRYPPLVSQDGTLYANNFYEKTGDPQGRVMGWNFGTPFVSVIGGQGALAEPQAISGGGSLIYRNLCCDRVGDYFDIYRDGTRPRSLWSYDLSEKAPGYDETWTIVPGWPRLRGWYQAGTGSINAAYHNHGDQNPIIPYDGKLFVHRSNTILAFGAGTSLGKLPLLTKAAVSDNVSIPSATEVRQTLESEVQKILDAGRLKPGYYNSGQFNITRELTDYYENPGETVLTLAMAYPHLSSGVQTQVRSYLQGYFADYFDPVMYASTGWQDGVAREAMPVPPDVTSEFVNMPAREGAGSWSWLYPPHNFYALWKYSEIVPEHAQRAYDLAKSKLQVPVPPPPLQGTTESDWFSQRPYEHNAYLVGYIGFLNLQETAGMTQQDSQLRTQVQNELNRLLSLRWQTFSKDSYWGIDNFHYRKHLDIARNFMYLVPELGDYYRQNIQGQVAGAFAEYETIAPYWFVTRFESVIGEGSMSNLYNSWAMFLAQAMIMDSPYEELARFIDVPAFERGDLYYIQKLVLALEAPGSLQSAVPDTDEHSYAPRSCRF